MVCGIGRAGGTTQRIATVLWKGEPLCRLSFPCSGQTCAQHRDAGQLHGSVRGSEHQDGGLGENGSGDYPGVFSTGNLIRGD